MRRVGWLHSDWTLAWKYCLIPYTMDPDNSYDILSAELLAMEWAGLLFFACEPSVPHF